MENEGSIEEVGGKVQVITYVLPVRYCSKRMGCTLTAGKNFFYDIDKTKIKLLYPVLQKVVQRHLRRKHKVKKKLPKF